MKTGVNTLVLGVCLLPSLSQAFGGAFGDSFGDFSILDAIAGLQDALKDLFAPPQVDGDLKGYEDLDSVPEIDLIGKTFEEFLLLSSSNGKPVDCAASSAQPMPTMDGVTDFFSGLTDFFTLISTNGCGLGGQFVAPRLFLKEQFAQPMVDFFAIIEDAASGRRLQEEQRELRTPPENLQCVTRLEEGSLNGILGRPKNLEGFTGQTNKYAWGTGFNSDLGFGVIVHSIGSLGAVTGGYSLPTFTIRDAEANIVFQGGREEARNDGDVNVGIRSAAVTNVEEVPDGLGGYDTIFTVIGSSLATLRGEFFEFKFSKKAYIDNNMQPLLDVRAGRRFRFEAPSVRSILLIRPDLILYAPNFDVNAVSFDVSGENFSFLRLFDLTTFQNVGPRIFLNDPEITEGDGRLTGIIWDFECSLEEDGLCFLNTVEVDAGDPELFLDEESTSVTSYFPLSSIPLDLAQQPVSNDEFVIDVKRLENDFDIDFSASSFASLSPASSVVCTLSGFLFRAASFRTNPEGASPDPAAIASLAQFDGEFTGLQELFELGEGQQCQVCTGQLDSSDRRRNNRRLKGGPGLGGAVAVIAGDPPLAPDTCQRIDILDQPRTSAYVWAVEECDGKIFIGTFDFASILGDLLLNIFIRVVAEEACSNPVTVALACTLNPFDCAFDADRNTAMCEEQVTLAINDALPSTLRINFATQLISIILGEFVSPEEIGFDLYVADVDDILAGNGVFTPVTQNGFRELSPAQFESDPIFVSVFGYEPSSQGDEGLRNMACHKSENGDTLIIGSAVFRTDASSNTYVLDTQCLSQV